MSVHRALRATSVATIVSFALALGSSVIVARLLTPTEIGIFSTAVSLIAFGHVLREFGVGQYIASRQTVTREDLQAAFSIMLIVSWLLAGLMLIGAPYAAQFYGQPGIRHVFVALAASFALLPFGSHILSMLKRDMAFDTMAKINIASAVVQTTVTLIGAWRGASYMSMAWGSLAGNLTTVLCLFAVRPTLALLPPTLKGLGSLLRFGGTASAASLVGRLGGSGPDLVLGKTLGMDAVAQFNRSNSLLAMFVWKIDEIVLQVFGPTFSKDLRDGKDPRECLRKAIETYSLVQFGILATLAIAGAPLIIALFGPQWEHAASLSTWLTLWSIIVVPIQLAPAALMGAGHAAACLRANLISNIALIAVLACSAVTSLEQMAWLFVLYRVVNLWSWLRELKDKFDFSARQCWTACSTSLGICAAGVAPAAATEAYIRAAGFSLHALAHITCVGGLSVLGIICVLQFTGHPLKAELARAYKLVAGKISMQ